MAKMDTRHIFYILGSILLLLIILQANTIDASVNTSRIGVSNGDVFTFVLDNYTPNFDEDYSPGYSSLTVQVGDEFTMTILNNNPIETIYGLVIEVEFDNGEIDREYDVDLVERADDEFGFIMFTDWTFWQTNVNSYLEDSKDAGDVDSYSVENNDKHFIVKTSFSTDTFFRTTNGNTVIVYEKSTGVLLYDYIKMDIKSETYTGDYKDELRRKGYSPPGSDNPSLPGFGMILTFSTFISMIIFLKKKITD